MRFPQFMSYTNSECCMSSEWGACGNSGSTKFGNSRRHPNNGRNELPPPPPKRRGGGGEEEETNSRDRSVARRGGGGGGGRRRNKLKRQKRGETMDCVTQQSWLCFLPNGGSQDTFSISAELIPNHFAKIFPFLMILYVQVCVRHYF